MEFIILSFSGKVDADPVSAANRIPFDNRKYSAYSWPGPYLYKLVIRERYILVCGMVGLKLAGS